VPFGKQLNTNKAVGQLQSSGAKQGGPVHRSESNEHSTVSSRNLTYY
jgi:hypothetical protein